MEEFELIKNYFQKLTKNSIGSLKLNDDVFFYKTKKLIVSVDTYNEGVHFLNFKYPHLVIKKILRSSISDLICKGINPKFYFISAAGNENSFTKKNLILISKSLRQEQKKYNIILAGGDTTYSKKISFSITVLGFSKNIIKRNNAKINDDIYVTGNIGDSFLGLKVIKNQIKLKKNLRKYFIKKYYCPDIPYNFHKFIKKYINTSIDISDGLIDDMKKLINKQDLSFEIYLDKIPTSPYINSFFKNKNLKKENYLFNGDDYQMLFTAKKKFRKYIKNISYRLRQKVSIIGKINNHSKQNVIFNSNNRRIFADFKGYIHKF